MAATPPPSPPELEPPPTEPGPVRLVLAVCAGECGEPVVEPEPLYRYRGQPYCAACYLNRVSEDR